MWSWDWTLQGQRLNTLWICVLSTSKSIDLVKWVKLFYFFFHAYFQNCQHNTRGFHCEKCLTGFYGNATIGKPLDCKACPCPMTSPPNRFVCTEDWTTCEKCSSFSVLPAGGFHLPFCDKGRIVNRSVLIPSLLCRLRCCFISHNINNSSLCAWCVMIFGLFFFCLFVCLFVYSSVLLHIATDR